MCLSNLTDVLASTVNEKVTDTAHVAVVEHRCPELSRQDEVGTVSGKPPQIHVAFQVQDLTLTTGCEWGPSAVHRDGACGVNGGSRDQVQEIEIIYIMMEGMNLYLLCSEQKKAFGILLFESVLALYYFNVL